MYADVVSVNIPLVKIMTIAINVYLKIDLALNCLLTMHDKLHIQIHKILKDMKYINLEPCVCANGMKL